MQANKFVTKRVIKENYLDTFGHMNNAKYLSLLEEVRWDWITSNGFGVKEMQRLAIGPTILEINLKFLKELRVRDEIEIRTQVVSYASKIGKLQQTILKDGQVYCIAEFTIGLFDLKSRRLILPTPEWLAAVGVTELSKERLAK